MKKQSFSMKSINILLFIIFSFAWSWGQELEVFEFQQYMKIVKTNHPVSFQAALMNDLIEGRNTMARGGFDPVIDADWQHKSFDDKNYYSLASGSIKVPTWLGIELKGGYDRNSGQFLSTSDFLPERGLWHAGISLPLGKGLMIDERRAELKRAKIFESATLQERNLMLNELYYNAASAYLQWQAANAYLDIAKEGLDIANTRFDGIKNSFLNGDKPAIDTLESLISIQSRILEVTKAEQFLENTRLNLNNYLWINGEVPVEIENNVGPEPIDIEILSDQVDMLALNQDTWIGQHPELLLYDFKIQDYTIDRRLARENLKPDLRVAYNPLITVGNDALFDEFNTNNYKLGASLYYPILARKTRGKIAMTEVKINTLQYEETAKNQSLKVKLNTYRNNIYQTQNQYQTLLATVENYSQMLEAENIKFSIGESSVFLVNSRETKYLDGQYKLLETTQKLISNRFMYLYFAAKLSDIFDQ